MKGGGGFIGNRIRTKNHNRSNHLRENCESDHADSDYKNEEIINPIIQKTPSCVEGTRSHSCFLIYGL